jgi:P-type Cu+ transporter
MGNTAFIVFDKTGTITRGEPTVHTVLPATGVDPDEVLRFAASAEMNSEHPLARAVEDEADARGLGLLDTTAFESHTGQGIEATLDGSGVMVGKPGWLAAQGLGLGALDDDREQLENEGQTVIAVSRDGRLLGLIGIGDTVKSDAVEATTRVKDAGITPIMITGDNTRTALTVAAQVGIDDVLAEVLPAGKAAEIRRLQETGKRVMMVGDGINDAPALTQADIGVAIGAGTDIAIESADIVIMNDRLGSVMDAHSIGVSSYRKTKQNLVLAFAFNGIGVLAAVTGLVSPVWAMIAMISSVTAVLANSFGGQLLRGEKLNTRYQSVTQDDHHGDTDEPENTDSFTTDRTALADVRIDGHTVRMWTGVATAITTLTLLAGIWQT